MSKNRMKKELLDNIKDCLRLFKNNNGLKVIKIKVEMKLWNQCYTAGETANGIPFMDFCEDKEICDILSEKEVDKVYAFGLPNYIVINFENTNFVQLCEINCEETDTDRVEGITDRFTIPHKDIQGNIEIEENIDDKDYGGKDIVSNILNNLDNKFMKK